jgi:hypothetical protein
LSEQLTLSSQWPVCKTFPRKFSMPGTADLTGVL